MGFDVSELICQARGDDPAAIEALLQKYRNYLRVLAQLWLPANLLAKLDDSDLVQETCMRAYKRFGQFRGVGEAELTAWLRKILARQVVDTVRQYQAASRRLSSELSLETMESDSADALGNLLSKSGTTPSEHLERRELGVILADALAELSDLHRQAVILRTLKDLSWTEVGAEMGRSTTTVRMLWVRGLSQLRTKLEQLTTDQ